MGGKRRLRGTNPAYLFKPLAKPCGFRSAYQSKEGPPLIRNPRRGKDTIRIQREIGRMHSAFSDFYKIVGKGDNKGNTHYDLHRDVKYWSQTRLLESSYSRFFEKAASFIDVDEKPVECLTVLDIGCGTGKLDRRIVRHTPTMAKLESGLMRMRILGVDFNQDALSAAVDKRGSLLSPKGHHPQLAGNLEMEYLLLDLLDLDRLDLSRTCIGEKKVDIVIATDVFRWIRASERLGLLRAIIKKLKSTGYLISMEFTNPPLPPQKLVIDPSEPSCYPHLSRSLAMRLGAFTFFEPMQLGDLYTSAENVGFRRVRDSFIDTYNCEIDSFPPLISIAFAPGFVRKGTKG